MQLGDPLQSGPGAPEQQTQVCVLGTGLGELAAALDFAAYGIKVTIIDSGARDTWPRGEQSDERGTLASWLEDVASPLREGAAPAFAVTHVTPRELWLSRSDRAVRVPSESVFGVPTSPLSTEVIAALGTGGALRAYLDRVRPVLTIGKTLFFGDLVRQRLGQRLLDTLVEPQVAHLFGAPAGEIETATIAPGLNELVTSSGSLSGAALAYRERYDPLAAGVMPKGGWGELYAALRAKLDHHGVQWVTAAHTRVVQEEGSQGPGGEAGDDRWRVETDSGVWHADVLVRPRELGSDDLTRVEIGLEHSEPAWWPAAAGEGATVIREGVRRDFADATPFTLRTTRLAEGRYASELRSPVQQGRVPITLEMRANLIATAGLPDALSDSVTVSVRAVAAPGDQAPRVREVDSSIPASERGLRLGLQRLRPRVTEVRRTLLGLA